MKIERCEVVVSSSFSRGVTDGIASRELARDSPRRARGGRESGDQFCRRTTRRSRVRARAVFRYNRSRVLMTLRYFTFLAPFARVTRAYTPHATRARARAIDGADSTFQPARDLISASFLFFFYTRTTPFLYIFFLARLSARVRARISKPTTREPVNLAAYVHTRPIVKVDRQYEFRSSDSARAPFFNCLIFFIPFPLFFFLFFFFFSFF